MLKQIEEHELPKTFHAVMRSWLTTDELKLVDHRNVGYDEIVCATHDFCDANMAMAEAWQTVYECSEDEATEMVDTEEGARIWSAAWGSAKAHGFSKEWADA
ncbi:MAG: hypothetical protein V3S55_15340 [Nitrospiraceae bacterium]